MNTLLHGEKIADAFKDIIIGRLSLESDQITCVFKSTELSPAGVRKMQRFKAGEKHNPSILERPHGKPEQELG